jgi:predicted GNAT superfamily acetyltransferase
VRPATPEDTEQLIALAGDVFNGTRYSRYTFNADKCRRLGQLEGMVLLVAVDAADRPVGFLAGVITDHYFADMVYATNIALVVSQEARGSRAALKLVREFERVAKARGADEIVLGVTAGYHAPRIEKFYNALGYSTVGALTVKYGE